MASLYDEILIEVPADMAWSALRDLGALHTRLAVGFVTDCRLEADGAARQVTFANGMQAREQIIAVDEARRRIVWSAAGGRLTHHNASAQVLEDDDAATPGRRCHLVWIADLLPHEMAPPIAAMLRQGLLAMKRTLEAA
ncbi:SRPBCC family protein [Roseateles sp. DAIF2]|uniref:SRPBCC family protein n=1 Tax=Roseateles sp. DAIF2 TaxID=2714952 RepID=UPI0018A2B6E0|nr:SRPBCC family protein [Roseateles sp. DAIF2]QPF75216.1 SRPBCC family protein [Roseateles sp. DAIF2]